MSLPDPMSRPAPRRLQAGLGAVCAALLLGLAGCSVQPLYGDVAPVAFSAKGPTAVGGMADALAAIDVREAAGDDPRVAQGLRNHLIFLLGRGAGRSAAPAYRLDLQVTTIRSTAARAQRQRHSGDLEPTAAVINVRAAYTITELATGTAIASGQRHSTAAFDVPRQEYAALRAERDAQDRAARETAEMLRLAIAQDLDRPVLRPPPRVISARGELEGFAQDEAD